MVVEKSVCKKKRLKKEIVGSDHMLFHKSSPRALCREFGLSISEGFLKMMIRIL